MPSYVAFLRAINVGGRFYKMADLREHLSAAGLREVETYIQTGNVRFSTSLRSPAKVEALLEQAMRERRGLEVPAVLFTPAELRRIHDDAAALAPAAAVDPDGGPAGRQYVTFFKEPLAEEHAAAIKAWDAPGEQAVAIGRAVHVRIATTMMDARFFNAFKKVLAPGTNRDLTVVAALARRWT